MPHEKTVQYDRPDGTDIGSDAGSGQWTGEKRGRKHLGLSLPTVSGDVGTSSACSLQEGQEDPDLNTIAETDLGSWDDDIDPEKIIEIMKGLRNKNRRFILCRRTLEDQEQRDVYRRILLYRLRAHKLSKKEFDKLDDDALKKELPDFLGTASLFRLHIDMHYYYESLKQDEDGSIDWYFDPEFSQRKYLSDYQRFLLTNDGEYLHWKDYCSSFTTYKVDKDYVAFCDEMSEKLQWLKLFIGKIGSDEWEKMDTRGFNQAVMTATKFPETTLDLVCTAYREHIWSLENDYRFREGWDSIFFAIWELVTEKKLEFTPAVIEVSKMHFVAARHVKLMLWDPESIWPDLKSKVSLILAWKASIPHYADNDFARKWIAKAVLKLPKLKIMHQYKKRKMEIAENIGLAQGCNGPRGAQLEGQRSCMDTEAGWLVENVDPVSLVSTQSSMHNAMVSKYPLVAHVVDLMESRLVIHQHDLCSSQIKSVT